MNKQRLRYGIIWKIIGYLILLAIIYLSLAAKPLDIMQYRFMDKIGHLLAYGTLMAWFSQLYIAATQRILLAIVFCITGVMLEYLQGWGGQRYFEYMDMLANTLGVLLGWWISSRICVGWLSRIDRLFPRK